MLTPENLERTLPRIGASIEDCTGEGFVPSFVENVAGGCINSTFIIRDKTQAFFLKLNAARFIQMFEAEADGLRELAAANCLKVPTPVCQGSDEAYSWLVLEHLPMNTPGMRADWEKLGRHLANYIPVGVTILAGIATIQSARQGKTITGRITGSTFLHDKESDFS